MERALIKFNETYQDRNNGWYVEADTLIIGTHCVEANRLLKNGEMRKVVVPLNSIAFIEYGQGIVDGRRTAPAKETEAEQPDF